MRAPMKVLDFQLKSRAAPALLEEAAEEEEELEELAEAAKTTALVGTRERVETAEDIVYVYVF